jgi:hypothetical protein
LHFIFPLISLPTHLCQCVPLLNYWHYDFAAYQLRYASVFIEI